MVIKHKSPGNSNNPGPGFIELLSTLPAALQKHFVAYLAACAMVAIVTIIAIIQFEDLRLCFGFLAALYVAYLGLDIVWSYASGKLICKQMICVKATKHPLLNCLDIICQDYKAEHPANENIHNFYVSNNKKNKVIFSEGTILDIYYRPDNPTQITTWTVLGYIHNT